MQYSALGSGVPEGDVYRVQLVMLTEKLPTT